MTLTEQHAGADWHTLRDTGVLGDLLSEFGGSVTGMCLRMQWQRTGALRDACAKIKRAAEGCGVVDGSGGVANSGKRVMVAEQVVCENRELEDPELIDRLWSAADEMQQVTRAADTEQEQAAYTIHGTLPIGLWSLGDAHIGADGVNYWDLKNTFTMLSEEPGLYGVINGDMIDGFVAHSPDTGRFSEVLRPRFQKRLAKYVCELLAPKLIALIGGQHEFFSSRLDDFDMAGYLAVHGKTVYLGPGGTLDLKFVDCDETYKVGVWHKYRGSSIYDETAGAKRLYREHGPFDVTMVADKHSPAASMEIRNGAMRAFMRGGTWKLRDDYSKSLGYTDAAVAVPMVILWPNEKRYWTTIDVDEGISYLRALRADCAAEDECA